jgi:ubiquinone/menaquinone biosynthesis C-methylase UbiE
MIPFQLHRRIPLVRRPFWQRDQATAQRDSATAERDASIARVHDLSAELAKTIAERDNLEAEQSTLLAKLSELGRKPSEQLRITVTRGDREWSIDPAVFETFGFQHGDELRVTPPEEAARLPNSCGHINILVSPGRAIRVPARYDFFEFKGFRIPEHLLTMTGAGPDTFDLIGRRHVELYTQFCGLEPDMTFLEVGCGIGRDAFQLIDVLGASGRYIGTDVTRDSIIWCQDNITPKHPNFLFHHFDAENDVYNPHGSRTSLDFALPTPDCSVDRIYLGSVFTHLFEAEVLHYMKEFARVLKRGGRVYATFFLHSHEALEAARSKGTTHWQAKFEIPLSDGVYANDPVYPRGGVAFTDRAMRRQIENSGLRLVRPYLKGSWSGLHAEPDEGQDVAILARADG